MNFINEQVSNTCSGEPLVYICIAIEDPTFPFITLKKNTFTDW